MVDPVTPPPSPAPAPAPFQNVTLRANLGDLVQVSVISKTEHSFTTECVNLSVEDQSVLCPVPNPNLRGNYTVLSASYPYTGLQLANKITKIYLDQVATYTITKNDLGIVTQTNSTAQPTLPAGNNTLSASDQQQIDDAARERRTEADRDPEISINFRAFWSLNQNALISLSLVSSQIPNLDNVVFSLAAQSCLRLEVTDIVYKLSLVYNGTTAVTADGSGSLVSLAQSITSNSTEITNAGGVVSFRSSTTIIANLVIPKVTNIVPVDCVVQTSPAPTPAPQLTSGITRYGIITNANTTQNSIGKYYGFSDARVNAVFNYDSIDKYAVLVKADNCFKVKIWIVIPAFFIPIIFPLWIDAKILTAILGAFESVLSAATGAFLQAVSAARTLKSQVSAKNAVALGARGAAIAKAATTEEGRAKLIAAAQKYAEKQIAKVRAVTDYNRYLSYANDATNLIDKAQQAIDALSAMDAVMNIINGNGRTDENTARALLQAIVTANNVIDTAFQEFSNFVDRQPDSAIKRKVQEVIRAIVDYLQHLEGVATRLGQTIDKNNPVEIVIAVLEVIIDIQGIRKFFHIAETMNLAQLAYDVILEEVDQLGALKVLAELDELGAKQEKSALEEKLISFAGDVAGEVDAVANAVADVLQINQLENLADAGIDAAISGINFAANALGGASEGVESRKRDEIRNVIAAYLMGTIDLYKISRIGRFDGNNLTERQILVNDLSGTRIYSADGNTLLWERKDFCRHPFVDLGNSVRLNSNGCQAGTNPCDVGGFNCQEKNYWYNSFQYRISFDFYDNHDLSKGGVVIGDFDGDGIDDIMCHLPGSTRNYDKITKEYSQRSSDDKSDVVVNNEIIYSPLQSITSNGRFQSREQSLLIYNNTGDPQAQKDWCKDGIIKSADFNGDKKADMLCVTSTNNYLLYSNGYTFRPAGNSTDGRVSLGITSNVNSLSNAVLVAGDYDGDGRSDLLKITASTADIYYGDAEQIFIQNATKTGAWLLAHSTKLASCYNLGVNRIIIDDVNNDGKDDISCVPNDNGAVSTILSTLNSTSTQEQAVGQGAVVIRIYINDAELQPYNEKYKDQAQQNIRTNYHTTNNQIGFCERLLVATDDMQSQKKSVSDITVSLDCLNLNNSNSETHISFSSNYAVPETLLWSQAQNGKQILLNLDVSAEFEGNNLRHLESTKIQSFEYRLEAVEGGCYKSQAVTHSVSLLVNYIGTARMVIESNGQILQGQDLEAEVRKFSSNCNFDDESIVSFPVNGQMLINILGVGYDVVHHCDND